MVNFNLDEFNGIDDLLKKVLYKIIYDHLEKYITSLSVDYSIKDNNRRIIILLSSNDLDLEQFKELSPFLELKTKMYSNIQVLEFIYEFSFSYEDSLITDKNISVKLKKLFKILDLMKSLTI